MAAVNLDYFENAGDGQHAIVARTARSTPAGRYVGTLRWDARTGIISGAGVERRYRRRGVATAMWDFAQDLPFPPVHPRRSPILTPDGRAWSRTITTGLSHPARIMQARVLPATPGHRLTRRYQLRAKRPQAGNGTRS